MPKRSLSSSPAASSLKRAKMVSTTFKPNKIATAKAAAAVDQDPPLPKLLKAVQNGVSKPQKGECVVYWMRMGDLRISDNRALSLASEQAKKDDISLIVIFALSPQDYIAHDRGARKIDFTLRSLSGMQKSLATLDIPLHVFNQPVRRVLPSKVVSFLEDYNCKQLFANIEYEVDELRRDIEVSKLAKEKGVRATLVHNRCVVEPGVIMSNSNKAYSVYSPYAKRWIRAVNDNLPYYLEDSPQPEANPKNIRSSKKFASLFETSVPDHLEGFELDNAERQKMEKLWPAGEDAAARILERFVHNKARSTQLGAADPLAPELEKDTKKSRLQQYDSDRDRGDSDSTSRLSPYLSAGILSIRECVRATMRVQKNKKVDASRNTGIGRWNQELAWRDFYTNVLAAFPRVSMGRPFLEKYADVVWEKHQDESGGDAENFKRWKEGMTGVPIVDAGMRCINETGWMHNRLRMIVAMFLTKDLMYDWRVGEIYFMENLIDGDLASNNGGWQWSASTGVDPAPYFRIFNPYLQSAKVDPSGDFIRTFVPELKKLKGNDIHRPSAETARALGYPLPIVKHEEVKDRAMRRYQNPGQP